MTSRPRTGRTILPYKVQATSELPSADLYKADLEHFQGQARGGTLAPGQDSSRAFARALGLRLLGGLVSGAMIGMSVVLGVGLIGAAPTDMTFGQLATLTGRQTSLPLLTIAPGSGVNQ